MHWLFGTAIEETDNVATSGSQADLGAACFTAALQDDYHFWHRTGENDVGGKLFIVDYDAVLAQRTALSSQMENDMSSHGRKAGKAESGATKETLGQDQLKVEKGAVIQIFFDDNIERDRAHIVDVQTFSDCGTYESVPFSISKNKFLVRVEPVSAIKDSLYYVKKVDEILATYY